MDAVAANTATYQRHAPEQDLLYQILCEHLETFLQECAPRPMVCRPARRDKQAPRGQGARQHTG